ncbi:MAG TPA: alpha-amylase family glycosyl hydrolase [Pseudogracilibacillus sp.]|nr:alpha-amylase family glycosyl hydrolase [Pseudogracilibacillus sp.]
MKKLVTFIIAIPFFMYLIPLQVHAENSPSIQDEIIYDILVDRFNNGSQGPSEQVDIEDPLTYTGGDIEGVTMMLDTLQEQGFTTISLSPIMENAKRGYHGYWIEDFYAIEEEFGKMEDLHELIEEAHDRGMKVMLELVTNYVAKTSPLTEEGDKQDWFKENEVEPIEATKWLDDVMVLDQENPAVQDFLLDVASFWMTETDIDGFKLHAADQASPDFLEKLTKQVKEENPNFYIIATTLQGNTDVDYLYENQHIDAIANDRIYEAMNDVLIKPDKPISKLYDVRGKDANKRDLLYVDTINTPRFSNNFAEQGRNDLTTWKLALSYLYFTPGVPIIYQGSEVPMYGPGFPENQYIVDFTSANPDLEKVFKQMAAVRKQFATLKEGDFEQVTTEEGFSLFKRTLDNETIYVGINNDSHSRTVTISEIEPNMQLRGLLHDDTIRANEDGDYLIGMERESAEVFVVRPNTGFNWGFIAFVAGVFIVFIGAIIYLTVKQKRRQSK